MGDMPEPAYNSKLEYRGFFMPGGTELVGKLDSWLDEFKGATFALSHTCNGFVLTPKKGTPGHRGTLPDGVLDIIRKSDSAVATIALSTRDYFIGFENGAAAWRCHKNLEEKVNQEFDKGNLVVAICFN